MGRLDIDLVTLNETSRLLDAYSTFAYRYLSSVASVGEQR